MTPEALSRRTTLPLEIVAKGIDALQLPDPLSRSPDCEGRRLELIDPARPWGWRIVNYAKYRQIRSAEDRRTYMREYQAKRRTEEKKARTKSEEPPEDSPIICSLPLRSGNNFDVHEAWLAGLAPLYPQVDVQATVQEMKGWLVGNPERRKGARGIRRFITSWLQREQDKAGGA